MLAALPLCCSAAQGLCVFFHGACSPAGVPLLQVLTAELPVLRWLTRAEVSSVAVLLLPGVHEWHSPLHRLAVMAPAYLLSCSCMHACLLQQAGVSQCVNTALMLAAADCFQSHQEGHCRLRQEQCRR